MPTSSSIISSVSSSPLVIARQSLRGLFRHYHNNALPPLTTLGCGTLFDSPRCGDMKSGAKKCGSLHRMNHPKKQQQQQPYHCRFMHENRQILASPTSSSSPGKEKKKRRQQRSKPTSHHRKERSSSTYKFVDSARIRVQGGTGGNGCVSHERLDKIRKRRGRPNGGNGGHGGRVILVADRNVQTLHMYKHHFRGLDGKHGSSQNKHGRNGRNVVVRVPCGVVVRRVLDYNGEIWNKEEEQEEEQEIAVQGIGFSEGDQRCKKDSTGEKTTRRDEKMELEMVNVQGNDYEDDFNDNQDNKLEERINILDEAEHEDYDTDDFLEMDDENDGENVIAFDHDDDDDHYDDDDDDEEDEEEEEEDNDDDDDDENVSWSGGKNKNQLPRDYESVVNTGIRSEDGMYYWKPIPDHDEDKEFDTMYFNDQEWVTSTDQFDTSPSTSLRRQKIVLADLDQPGSYVIVATGGRGGIGNGAYAKQPYKPSSAIAYANARRARGRNGTAAHLELELKLIADIGLVGFPNAGKSSLLAAMSKAQPEIAPYPFTTLHPLVGCIEYRDGYRVVAADVPGLIEGASTGRGRGYDFLRHLERTKALLYIVDVAGVDGRDPVNDLRVLTKEMASYGDGDMLTRPALVVANKVDLISDEQQLNEILLEVGITAEEEGILFDGDVLGISAGVTGEGLSPLSQAIRNVVLQSDERRLESTG